MKALDMPHGRPDILQSDGPFELRPQPRPGAVRHGARESLDAPREPLAASVQISSRSHRSSPGGARLGVNDLMDTLSLVARAGRNLQAAEHRNQELATRYRDVLQAANEKLKAAQDMVRSAEDRALRAEALAREAEERAKQAEALAQEAEEGVKAYRELQSAREIIKSAESRALRAEALAREAEERTWRAEARADEAEDMARSDREALLQVRQSFERFTSAHAKLNFIPESARDPLPFPQARNRVA
jgi:hypothetical protein